MKVEKKICLSCHLSLISTKSLKDWKKFVTITDLIIATWRQNIADITKNDIRIVDQKCIKLAM